MGLLSQGDGAIISYFIGDIIMRGGGVGIFMKNKKAQKQLMHVVKKR